MQYFRFLPDPAKLRREARWSGVSSVPDIGERVQPSADVGAGNVTAYFVDNGRLGVLVRLELYPDKDGPDFHFLGHERDWSWKVIFERSLTYWQLGVRTRNGK
jgi:hypothetical protein